MLLFYCHFFTLYRQHLFSLRWNFLNFFWRFIKNTNITYPVLKGSLQTSFWDFHEFRLQKNVFADYTKIRMFYQSSNLTILQSLKKITEGGKLWCWRERKSTDRAVFMGMNNINKNNMQASRHMLITIFRGQMTSLGQSQFRKER